jgi:hypothetical protein
MQAVVRAALISAKLPTPTVVSALLAADRAVFHSSLQFTRYQNDNIRDKLLTGTIQGHRELQRIGYKVDLESEVVSVHQDTSFPRHGIS